MALSFRGNVEKDNFYQKDKFKEIEGCFQSKDEQFNKQSDPFDFFNHPYIQMVSANFQENKDIVDNKNLTYFNPNLPNIDKKPSKSGSKLNKTDLNKNNSFENSCGSSKNFILKSQLFKGNNESSNSNIIENDNIFNENISSNQIKADNNEGENKEKSGSNSQINIVNNNSNHQDLYDTSPLFKYYGQTLMQPETFMSKAKNYFNENAENNSNCNLADQANANNFLNFDTLDKSLPDAITLTADFPQTNFDDDQHFEKNLLEADKNFEPNFAKNIIDKNFESNFDKNLEQTFENNINNIVNLNNFEKNFEENINEENNNLEEKKLEDFDPLPDLNTKNYESFEKRYEKMFMNKYDNVNNGLNKIKNENNSSNDKNKFQNKFEEKFPNINNFSDKVFQEKINAKPFIPQQIFGINDFNKNFNTNPAINLDNKNNISNANNVQFLFSNSNLYFINSQNNINPIQQSLGTKENKNMNPNKMNMNNRNNQFGQNQKQVNILSNINPNKVEDIIENISVLSKNKKGCKLLQKVLTENPDLADEQFYPAIKNHITIISMNSFGNYFIQKLFDYLSIDKLKEILIKNFKPNFNQICLNPHGTRVIQKLLEKIYTDSHLLHAFEQIYIPNLLELTLNQNSTHILIKYISLLREKTNEDIINFLCENAVAVSNNKHSCCTYQKSIEYINSEKYRKKLLLAIAMNSYKLFNDPSGNYIIQFVLAFGDMEVNQIINQFYFQNFLENVSQKCSSNVFEKCMQYSNEETKLQIIKSLCNQKMVQTLLFNMYGNFGKFNIYNILFNILVLQKVMQSAEEPYKTMFCQYVGPLLNLLNQVPFGGKVLHNLLNKFPQLIKYRNNNQQNYYNQGNYLNNNL